MLANLSQDVPMNARSTLADQHGRVPSAVVESLQQALTDTSDEAWCEQ